VKPSTVVATAYAFAMCSRTDLKLETKRASVSDVAPRGSITSISENCPRPLDRATERSGELAARGDPFAHAADRGRDSGKMPVIEIVEARFRLEHPQHLPALVVEQHDDRIEPVAAAIAELPAGHLEGALAFRIVPFTHLARALAPASPKGVYGLPICHGDIAHVLDIGV